MRNSISKSIVAGLAALTMSATVISSATAAAVMNRDRAFDRRNDGRKFQQHAVAPVAANDQPTTSRPPDSFGSFTTIARSAQKGLAFRSASSIVSLSDAARMTRG